MRRGSYRLRVAPQVVETRRHLHPAIKRLLNAAVSRVAANPYAGKSLAAELAGYWSIRTGRYRLIYRIAPDRTLDIVAFGPRRTIYEETHRLVNRPGRQRPMED